MSLEASPAVIFDALTAYQRSAALKAGIDLDLFTAIAEGNHGSAALAARCKASERGVRILCDYLTAAEFLEKRVDGYHLAPISAMFLDRTLPTYVGSLSRFLNSPVLMDEFRDVAAAVRRGGTVIEHGGSTAPEHPMWVEFARAMAPLAGFTAEVLLGVLGDRLSDARKILDVAAGHGLYGITFARHLPHASVVALDWANVLAVAEENARAAGVQERFSTIAGSAFEIDLGSGYDLVLIPNFLHHFDVPTCESFLRKVHAALAPGAQVLTVEFVPNEDRVSPPVAAMFGLVMLVGTPGGDAYTFAEYERMFRNAGFGRSELFDLTPIPQRAILSSR